MSMEIKPQWKNVFKRMQSIARKYSGTVVIKSIILVNGDGVPTHWLIKDAVAIEPKLDSGLDSLMAKYGEDDLKEILNVIMNSL